jgi:hypothetical protein
MLDVVHSLGAHSVSNIISLRELLYEHNGGDKVLFLMLRGMYCADVKIIQSIFSFLEIIRNTTYLQDG